jgi:NADH:ubiquinone reductase (H+-translocating)
VATGILSEGAIAPALRSMFRHQPNVRMLLAEVTDIDLAARIVRARVPDGDDLALGYDTRSSRPARPTATSATASGPRRPSG